MKRKLIIEHIDTSLDFRTNHHIATNDEKIVFQYYKRTKSINMDIFMKISNYNIYQEEVNICFTDDDIKKLKEFLNQIEL